MNININPIKRFFFIVLAILVVRTIVFAGGDKKITPEIKEQTQHWMKNRPVQFLENKGQMTDMDSKPVPFVLFKASAPGMDMYITEKGLTYVFIKTEEEYEKNPLTLTEESKDKQEQEEEKHNIEWSRIDMDLKGASIKKENIVKERPSVADFNYFYPHCSEGIYGVKQYEKITIKDIYPNIDWVLYNAVEKGFKYDFIVHPNADPSQIKLLYCSAKRLQLSKDGNILIETNLGTLTENAPISYLRESGSLVASVFSKTIIDKHSTEISFQFSNFSGNETLIIDPQLQWGTYFGGNGWDGFSSVETDGVGNVFVTGYTQSASFPTLNLSGAYFQGANAGFDDVCLLKFSNAGVLLWATYYGGTGNDRGYSIAIDASNNVFVTGMTNSPIFPTLNPFGGSYFQAFAGGNAGNSNSGDLFLLKFSNTGLRIWATYYGGTSTDVGYSLAIDAIGNVFVTGETWSTNFPTLNLLGAYYQVANAGSSDAFLLKFSNTGVPLWASYYGGSGTDIGRSLATDGTGNLFVTGETVSTVTFPTLNPFQAANAGGSDAFLLKFDPAGVMNLATFYGGTGNDYGYSLATDGAGNVFVIGSTGSINFPTLNPFGGAYFQGANAGGADLFLLKFSNTGIQLWATYYGGSGIESFSPYYSRDHEIVIDASGSLFVTGYTTSTNFPTLNPGGGAYFQATNAGGVGSIDDVFLLKFRNTGVPLWATYNGTSARDFGAALTIDANGCLFAVGEWDLQSANNSNGLMNPGAGAYYDASCNGADEGFIMKFCTIASVLTTTASSTPILCKGQCTGTGTAFPAGGTSPYSYSWNSSGQTTQTATGLCAGSYTVIVTDGAGGIVTATVSIADPPLLTVALTSTINVLCKSQCTGSATVAPAGGTPGYIYSWNTAPAQTNATATGLCAGTYTCTITDANGCDTTQIVTITEPAALTSTLTSIPDTCNKNNGMATVMVNGGTPTYTYNWSPSGGNTANASGLTGGTTYTVIITDANSCTQTQTVTIATTNSPTVTLTAQTNVSCNGGNNGNATVNVGGGTPGYSYSWVPSGGTNITATGLSASAYIVTVTDANGCTTTETVTITQPSILTTSIIVTAATCNSDNGSANVSANGGTPSYTYLWNNGQITQTATGLGAGSYTATITDANGCTNTVSITVVEIPCPCPNLKLTLPSAFSPNNDGENDEFCLQGGIEDCIKELTIVIYDRWGEKVYESIDKNFCWDGTYKSKLQNTAVFVYYLDAILISGETIIKKGNISLIR